MIAAIDFDGTLCEFKYPDIGEPNEALIQYLIHTKSQGTKLILWTCRSGQELTNAVEWCKERGLEFDAVNANLLDITEKMGFKDDSRKIFADLYVDDKAMTPNQLLFRVNMALQAEQRIIVPG